MAKVRVGDIDIYYEATGEGYPIILIRGLGSNADHWYAQVPAFSERYRVITFDNRGIGRSDRPDGPYSISMMADDVVGLLEAIGVLRAHVLGLSMGGMIAQDIAIRYPEKVGGLVLACTHCGRNRAIPPSEEVLKNFTDFIYDGSVEAAQRAVMSLFAESTPAEAPEIFQRYQAISKRFPPELITLRYQWEAVGEHDVWGSLAQIKAPTLVITGKEDAVIPAENSRILAEKIPGAKLEIMEGGHQFLIEHADAFNRAVLDFLGALPFNP
jgi:pimeloyl-ACP methyl ester carboxylesterase